jgi:hypothetical protein
MDELNDLIGALYADRTSRTMWREPIRLRELGFIAFEAAGDDTRVSVDFNAISKY